MIKEKIKSTFVILCLIIFLIFITLKIINVSIISELSYFWICAPLWGSIPLIIIFTLLTLLINLINITITLINNKIKKK